MAWIESHQALEKHPKVLELSRRMGWSLDETIGKLHRFWWWCLDYAPTGDLRHVAPETIAHALGISPELAPQLLSAMMQEHWICRQRQSKYPLRVHDWNIHAGRYLRDYKFKRHPERLSEVIELYKIPCAMCQPTVSRQSADNPQTVSRKSAVPTNHKEEKNPDKSVVHIVDNSRVRIPGEADWAPIQDQLAKIGKPMPKGG